ISTVYCQHFFKSFLNIFFSNEYLFKRQFTARSPADLKHLIMFQKALSTAFLNNFYFVLSGCFN
ncbi:hypothetical protein, partial [Carnobacterium maltaromaticum]|uniref:hypothetical protein n=1 Tax=Carnobacterium maltaromaticum TaxID=2751 RepID=UPI0039B0477E